MSVEPNLMITLPEQSMMLIAVAPVAVLVLVLLVVVIRKSRAKKSVHAAFAAAASELGIEVAKNGTDGELMARGRVNEHVVSVAPVAGAKRKRRITKYAVAFEAPEAPQFTLTKRDGHEVPTVDTGNPKFDAVVAVRTDQPVLLARFLTGARRAAILRLLTYWPTVEITNRSAQLTTPGVESDPERIVDAFCHLVASAETFDRPTPREPVAAPLLADDTAGAAVPQDGTDVAASPADAATDGAEDVSAQANVSVTAAADGNVSPDSCDEGSAVPATERDLLTEVRLDEMTTLNDLFNSGLDDIGIAARFEQVYRGREVSWTGEVLRVGSTDRGRQRIAALVGSADGQSPDSGRVVALTAVGPEPVLSEGDVVSFSGALVNLDATQRLFHIA